MLNDVQDVADAAAGSDCESVHTEVLLQNLQYNLRH